MPKFGPSNLDAFVAHVDSLGGPGFPGVEDYWRDFAYVPEVRVDTALDPLGTAYFDQQLALYNEISGRVLDQSINEHTVFDHGQHLLARNPYNHGEPGVLATQLVQLATALRLANPRRGARMIDMGCGWGLSSELAAYAGLEVEAIDINPDFIRLVQDRSERYRYGIRARQAAFDDFSTEDRVDLILFYECLHHAVQPWSLIKRLAGMLAPGGKIVACGEPINTHWWPHWGLRLDPMSVYCIRKHGWFESGWSADFIVACMDRALLSTRIVANPDPAIGEFIVASAGPLLSPEWMLRNCTIEGAELDGDYLVASGETHITFDTPIESPGVTLAMHNFRGKPVLASVRWDQDPSTSLHIPPGESRLLINGASGSRLSILAETWVPAQELGTPDTRCFAFHIGGICLDHGIDQRIHR